MSGASPLEQIVDHVVSGAEQKIPGLVSGWLERVAAWGSLRVAELPEVLRPVGQQAVGLLLAHTDVLAGVSQRAVVAIASHLALGQGDEAQRVYLATQASFEEQSAALAADAQATQQQVQDRDAAWQKVKDVLEELLLAAGKAAVPLLLAL